MSNEGSYSREEIEKMREKAALKKAVSGGAGQGDADLADDLVNPEEVKRALQRSLLGKEKYWAPNAETGELELVEKEHEKRKIINEEGFGMIWRTVSGLVSTNTTGAYWSKKDIEDVGFTSCAAVIQQLFRKRDQYEVADPEDATQIISIIAAVLKATTSKGKGGRGLKHKERSIKEQILRRFDDQSGEDGALDRLGGMV